MGWLDDTTLQHATNAHHSMLRGRYGSNQECNVCQNESSLRTEAKVVQANGQVV